MIDRVVSRFIGTKHERDLKVIQPLVTAINALGPQFETLSDAEILEKILQLRTQVQVEAGRSSAGRSPIQGALRRKRWNPLWFQRLLWYARWAAGSWACAISTCS